MKANGKRLLSFLLAASMCVTLLPTIGFAAEGDAPPSASQPNETPAETPAETPDKTPAVEGQAPAETPDETPAPEATLPLTELAPAQKIAQPQAADAADAAEYEIYPTPHGVTYGGAAVQLPAALPAVYESGIDAYTVQRGADALAQAGMTQTATDAIGEGMHLLVGVQGSGGVVDQYFTAQGWADADLFLKNDSYLLRIGAHGVAVLGKDTDAAFYGLTTLKRILSQVSQETRTVSALTVRDYSDIPFRGFIEGYYGNPWSNEDRAELMRFGGELKMNTYFYAPKDDPKHNAQWRALYTDEELVKIKALAQAGEESKCRYVFALHTFMSNPVRFDSNYAADLEVVKAKLLQVIDKGGVRQVAILADDAGVPGGNAANYVTLIRDLTTWLTGLQPTYPGLKNAIPFCPNDYMGNGASAQLKLLGNQETGLPSTTPLVVTGGKVWGEVSDSFIGPFFENTTRGPYIWTNWPCTDNSKSHLIMGGYKTFLHPNINPEKVQGIILNPMQQSEPSQVAIFGNAEFAWNVWDEARADKAWEDSFKYVDHMSAEETPTSAALRELSRHMINQNMDSRVAVLQESTELAPKLTALREKLDTGASIIEDATALKAEFQTLAAAAATYRDSGRERLKGQISYWLKAWDDVTAANIALLEALIEIEQTDGSPESSGRIVSLYTQAQARYEASRTYGFHYVDHTEYAEVGVQHIMPFTRAILSKVSEAARTLIDPTILIQTPITNRTDTPTGGLASMADGNSATEAVFKTPNSTDVGTYVGVKYNRAIPVTEVRFEMGTGSNPRDTFSKCKLQYTQDGKTWQDIEGAAFESTNAVLEKTGLSLSAMGVRAIATERKEGMWLGVREIYINKKPAEAEPAPTLLRTQRWTISTGAETALFDKNDTTEIVYDTGAADDTLVDDFIGVDLGKVMPVGNVHFVMGKAGSDNKWAKYVLEYSSDNSTWTTHKSYEKAVSGQDILNENLAGASARYVRLRNTEQKHAWMRFGEITVEKYDPSKLTMTLQRTPTWAPYQDTHPESALFDGNDATYVWYKTKPDDPNKDDTLVGDYIGVDLGKISPVGKVHFAVGVAESGDKWTNYDLKYSADNSTWTTYRSYTGVASGQDIINENLAGVSARYIRLVNTKQLHAWVRFGEIKVEGFDPNTQTQHLYKSKDAAAEGVTGDLTADSASLAARSVTLAPGEFVGIQLPRIRELTEITAQYGENAGLAPEAGCNAAEMKAVSAPLTEAVNARYIRLRNTSSAPITFALSELKVTSRETSGPAFVSSTAGDVGESTVSTGMFDANVNTLTTFAAAQAKDHYVLYDLGQTRNVSKLQMIVQDTQRNYLRDGKVQIALDKAGTWTDVITIGDNVANTDGADSTALDAGWAAAPGHPNYVCQTGSITAQPARYLRILVTQSYANRWLSVNEMVINDGEYVPSENNPTFVAVPAEGAAANVPAKLLDGDITTAFKPNMTGSTTGSLLYRLSDKTAFEQINILQSSSAISRATVELREANKNTWTALGTLDAAFNTFYVWQYPSIAEIRLSWGDTTPMLYEIIPIAKGAVPLDTHKLQTLLDALPTISAEDEGKYDPAQLAAYRAAVQAAKTLLAGSLEGVTQAQLNQLHAELVAAYAPIMAAGTLHDAKAALQAVLDAYVETSYTPNSWTAYLASAAYTGAQNALRGTELQAVQTALTALQAEAQKLALRANLTQLSTMLDLIAKLNANDYVPSTFAALQTAVTEVKAAMTNLNATQAEVDALLSRLVAAKDALVHVSSDDDDDYTPPTTTTTTTTDADGTKVTTVTDKKTGATTVTATALDGTTAKSVTDKNGKTEATVTVPEKAVKNSKDGIVQLPVKGVEATKDGARIGITLPQSDGATKVGVPVKNLTDGTIAVLVKPDGTEEIIVGAAAKDGVLIVPMSGSGTIEIRDNSKDFSDVKPTDWAASAVQFVTSRELFNGTGNNLFSQNENMNRAMLTTVLFRLANEPKSNKPADFGDVTAGMYYTDAVAWASENNIVTGNGKAFDPNGATTREQLALMLYRYAGSPVVDTTLGNFADSDSVSDWAQTAMVWATQNKIIGGTTGNNLAPQASATRAEVATMLQRFVTR